MGAKRHDFDKERRVTTDWDEPDEQDDDEADEDTGFLGGGGPAETIEGGDERLDEHGDNLAKADEDDL